MANEDKATRYHRLQRRASVLATASAVGFLLLLLVTGLSAAIRGLLERAFSGAFVATAVGYVCVVFLLYELVQMPFAYYQGIVLERRYGLSTETRQHWWVNHAKAAGVGLAFGVAGAVLVVTLIRWNPDSWWMMAALLFVAILVGLAQLAPVVLLPLFYTFTPLNRPELVARLVALADRAGARVVGVFEWRLSDRTRKANAALTGIGSTRRILLSDTLLAEHSDDEIEVILAHELAHHVHRDIWSGIALETVLITAGLFVADAALTRLAGSFGLLGKGDVAALPLLLLATAVVSLLFLPLANGLSRAHERRADRYALTITRNAEAFVSAMKRLAAQNLAEEQPPAFVEWLLHSHPSTQSRIDAARRWAAEQS
jgi:Zn-dependent protease with chaperone function